MAEKQGPAGSSKLVVSIAAIAATLGGWLAMAVHDAPVASSSGLDAPSLAPLPTLEPRASEVAPVPARRPVPMATTRSSR
ncbi:MAG TPA: hypothetical protein VF316_16010 [Polyangiaceae bacterium]